jgi:peroxiredoxin (alkyl hydroperoxide reductase subunit C)
MGCEIVTVSCDTKFVHLAWQREEKELANVKFHMGQDRSGKLAQMFGIFNDGFALRGSFLIAPDGKLMNTEINFLNLGRNIDEQLRKFKANIYLSKKSAEGCPAKWKDEGDMTLKPGPEMVGRVHEALKK